MTDTQQTGFDPSKWSMPEYAQRAYVQGWTEGLDDLTDDEATEVDRAMGEHMYSHSISNNINGMSCDVRCRTRGLAYAVNKVLRARREVADV